MFLMTDTFQTIQKTYYHVTTLAIFVFSFIVLFDENYMFALALSFAFWLLGVNLYMGYRSWKVFREDKEIFYLVISFLSYALSIFLVYDISTTTYELIINNL